jgi:hypothetical protein
MQDSIDNELYLALKFNVQDLAVTISECLDKISRKEPDIAKQKLADLQVIFAHLGSSLKATDYTNKEIICEGMQWYINQIEKITGAKNIKLAK